MQYISHYRSPLGGMLLAADEQGLTGLWFEGQKYFALHLIDGETEEREIPLFGEVKRWLDIYFSGKEPDFKVPLHLQGTAFQREVWEILCGIPYGKTVTYGEIAGKVTPEKFTDIFENAFICIRADISPCCGRCCGTQSGFCHCALPPGHRGGWKPDRICGRHGQEGEASETGKCGFEFAE